MKIEQLQDINPQNLKINNKYNYIWEVFGIEKAGDDLKELQQYIWLDFTDVANPQELLKIFNNAKLQWLIKQDDNGELRWYVKPQIESKLNLKQYLQVRTQEFKDWFGDRQNYPESASKVVDENGELLVVYHWNIDHQINKFEKNKDDRYSSDVVHIGFYFGNYFSHYWGWIKKTYECFLRIMNLKTFSPSNWVYQWLGSIDITIPLEISYKLTTHDWILQLGSFHWNENTSIDEYDSFIEIHSSPIYNLFKDHFGRENWVVISYMEANLITDWELENYVNREWINILYPVIQELVVFNPNQIKSADQNGWKFSSKNDNIYG